MSEYTGYDFDRVDELEVFSYWGYLHDAVVWSCSRTAAGREYLENAYCYQQQEPDRERLRSRFR